MHMEGQTAQRARPLLLLLQRWLSVLQQIEGPTLALQVICFSGQVLPPAAAKRRVAHRPCPIVCAEPGDASTLLPAAASATRSAAHRTAPSLRDIADQRCYRLPQAPARLLRAQLKQLVVCGGGNPPKDIGPGMTGALPPDRKTGRSSQRTNVRLQETRHARVQCECT